jgi:hypothetical protein
MNIWNARFYPDLCEDCAEEKELALCEFPLVPLGKSAVLCRDCEAIRRNEHFRAEEPRPIGFTPAGDRTKWVDLSNLMLCVSEKDEVVGIPVKVMYRRPTVADPTPNDGGEIKVLIGENDRWLWVDFIDPKIFGFDPARAISNAKAGLQAMMTEHRVSFTKVSLG